eukprot:10919175-Alexandrium_andersonii.AAC.1
MEVDQRSPSASSELPTLEAGTFEELRKFLEQQPEGTFAKFVESRSAKRRAAPYATEQGTAAA